MYAPKTALPSNPMEWGDIKYWLRLDDDSEQANVMALAGDMLLWAEDVTNSTLVARTRTVTHYEADDALELPYGPVVSVVSVVDATGAGVAYQLHRAGPCAAVRLSASAEYPVTVIYNAGNTILPDYVRRAVLMAVDAMYNSRDGSADLSGAMRLLNLRSQSAWIL